MGPCEGHFSGFRLDVVSQLYASTDQPEGAVYVCFLADRLAPGPEYCFSACSDACARPGNAGAIEFLILQETDST